MHVRFLGQAKEDMVEIQQYYRQSGGIVLAKKMLRQIKLPVLKLESNPKAAPLYELAPGIHRLVVAKGAFLVFYRVLADVEVLHLRRAEREPVKAEFLEEISNG